MVVIVGDIISHINFAEHGGTIVLHSDSNLPLTHKKDIFLIGNLILTTFEWSWRFVLDFMRGGFAASSK